jgi:ribose transport system substrate-binding protein
MSRAATETRTGVIQSVIRACEVLRAFRYDGESLRLRDVVSRTGLSKSTAHRFLHSLEAAGLIRRVGAESYVSLFRPVERRRVRLGYASQTASSTFAQTVSASIEAAAAANNVGVIRLDNRYSPKVALRNVEHLISEHVDLAIEFQTHENVAPVVAARLIEAGIPAIAVEIPHPGAVYFGANNYQAGLIGGRALGKWASQVWKGEVDEILLLEERVAGPLPHSRLTGMLAGIREVLPASERAIVSTFDSKGAFGAAQAVVRQHLRRSPARRVLVAALNDPAALGALRAFEECGRAELCAVMGQNAIREARDELRRPNSRLIGTVAYFPELYGENVIPLALAILSGKPTPPAVFMKHQLVTARNVDLVYPLDTAS